MHNAISATQFLCPNAISINLQQTTICAAMNFCKIKLNDFGMYLQNRYLLVFYLVVVCFCFVCPVFVVEISYMLEEY